MENRFEEIEGGGVIFRKWWDWGGSLGETEEMRCVCGWSLEEEEIEYFPYLFEYFPYLS